jgi:hypothetical protein
MHRAPAFARAVAVLAAAGLLALAALDGRGAHAAGKSREQREAEARKHCTAGRVEAGIEILAELYTQYNHPNYIYNQGRCYQQNGRAEQAITRFKEYLRAASEATPKERARVEQFIRELEAELPAPAPAPAPRAAEPPAPAPPAPVTEPARPERLPALPPPAPPGVAQPATSGPASSHHLRTAGIALGVTALAGVTLGVVSSLQVRALSREVETAKIGGLTGPRLTENEKKGERFETLQWVGYGIGAAAGVGAIVCLVMDVQASDAGERAGRPRLIATVGPGGAAGVLVAGRF